MRVCVCACVHVCMCVCVRERGGLGMAGAVGHGARHLAQMGAEGRRPIWATEIKHRMAPSGQKLQEQTDPHPRSKVLFCIEKDTHPHPVGRERVMMNLKESPTFVVSVLSE